MSGSQRRRCSATINITPALRDRLRVEKAERGVTYDTLLRDELGYELDEPEATR